MVSLIPADVGKPTVKSDKAMVQNETCRWENPVYETVKFNREPRTGKISERIYYVHVSNVCFIVNEVAGFKMFVYEKWLCRGGRSVCDFGLVCLCRDRQKQVLLGKFLLILLIMLRQQSHPLPLFP